MTEWINKETGEIVSAACALCAETEEAAEVQVRAMEGERRNDRAKVAKLEKLVEGVQVGKRDGALWERIAQYWIVQTGRKPSTLVPLRGVRANLTFKIIDAGADEARVMLAIDGAAIAPYKSYGARTAKPSGKKLDDLKDICKDEAEFEALVAIAEAHRAAK